MRKLIFIAIVLIAGMGVVNAQEQALDLSLEKDVTPIALRSASSVPTAPFIESSSFVLGNYTFFNVFAISNGATSYEWIIWGADIIWGQGTNRALLKVTEYYYEAVIRVRAKNANGYSEYSEKRIPYDCNNSNPF